MNILGSLRVSAASSVRSCSRRMLSEAGPSRLVLTARSLHREQRCFNTSTVTDFPPTQPLRFPRWVNNTKQSAPPKLAESSDSSATSGESPESQASTEVRLDSSEDSQAPPQSSAPPSSSSSSSGDGSDSSGSDPPPSPPPDPPTQNQTSISKQSVPENYPEVLALPIARRPLFPGFYKAVVIRNPAVVAAIKEMMRRGQPYLGAFLLKDEHADSDVITDLNQVHSVGVFAQITSVFAANTGPTGNNDEKEEGLTAVLYPHRRIKITDLVKTGGTAATASIEAVKEPVPEKPEPSAEESLPTPPPTPKEELVSPTFMQTSFLHQHNVSIVRVENLVTQPYNKDDQYIRAFMSEIVSVFKDIAQLNPLFRDQKFKERAASLKMPEHVKKVFDEELNKLQHLEPAASEANVTRNYLEWLTQIPWGQHSRENYSIAHATKVLDEDHYGLQDVKDRILEFLAVGKLRGTVQGKIICLVGPPGVGKTSIGKSIARALNRQFFRFSVGGLTDVAEIKGHRRTYVGALPGKIIQALKRVGTENPLVLIDEVDKIGRGHNGDPSSALLEMLDPEQNTGFLDHYMDVPVDLSRVLFVCTANVLDTIPPPLLDRMEVLEVSGYVSEEKAVIADKYLGPQAKEASGLKDADVQVMPSAIDVLIKYYCRESGVRNLKKHIEKIYRKAALKLVQDLGEDVFPEPDGASAAAQKEKSENKTVEKQDGPPPREPTPEISTAGAETETTPSSDSLTERIVTTVERKPLRVPDTVHVHITPENLKDYVGPPVYHKDRLYVTAPPAGVSSGLGYLGNGSGAVMPIEATSMPGKGGLQLTGKLGEVIRESAQIALSWVKSHAYELGITKSPDEQFLTDRDIHVHMPEGSIGKEGPSAGTAILSAYVSLFTKTKINPDIAMTGEISLVGQILPVGGLKEKILAAHRAGIKTIIAPEANRPDIEENVPESVKTGIRFVYVEDVREVLHEVFRGEPVAERWKDTLSP
ncbi:unnamed protein product [Somion occarium]|uniref:Endopeptidase La n=1 Tax=Somion occarium TaxID=3059160 RepID=A0ABP1ECB4_9APHY